MASLQIPITKAGNKKIEVDTDVLPLEMYQLVVEEGLKVVLNKKMSKIMVKGLADEKLAEAQQAAMDIATKNLADLMEGKVRRGRAAAGTKVAGVVMTEARRLAKEIVKNEIRAAGIKVSHVEASEITKLANQLIEADPSLIETAKANIEARKETKVSINIASLVHVSPKLVAKAEAEKEAKKSTLSKTQAGKVAPRKAKAGATATATA